MYRKQRKTDPTYEWKRGKKFPPEIQLYEKLGKQYDAGHPFCHHNRYL